MRPQGDLDRRTVTANALRTEPVGRRDVLAAVFDRLDRSGGYCELRTLDLGDFHQTARQIDRVAADTDLLVGVMA